MLPYNEIAAHLPAFFEPMLQEQYGNDVAHRIIEGYGPRRPVTLRANTLKATHEEVATALDEARISWQGVAWYPDAFVLEHVRERTVQDLPLYTEGKIYLQSLSSMLPALILEPREGADILDMAAAPSGKTTQMAALTAGKAHITACEMHAPRADKLDFNLKRQGATNVNVMRTDARRLDDYFSFDQVLLDAPCSGSGTLDIYDPQLTQRFTLTLIERSKVRQEALLAKALKLVKVGECVVYSTCSVLEAENEDVVRHACAKGPYEVVPISVDGMSDVPQLPTTLPGTLGVCPTELYEGFFVAKIRRLA